MTQVPTPTVTQGLGAPEISVDGGRFRLEARGEEIWVQDQASESTRRVALQSGSHRMEAYWVSDGTGGYELLPFTYLIADQRLVPRDAVFIRPDDALAAGPQRWQHSCMPCHTVGSSLRAAGGTGRLEPQVAELSITCEACHGPAGEHVSAQAHAPTAEHIVHPGLLDHERAADVCGQCHAVTCDSERLTHGGAFLPGLDLHATSHVLRYETAHESPCMEGIEDETIIKTYLDGVFWSDGHTRVTGREYNGITSSECYLQGTLTCISCHDLHGADPDAMIAPEAKGDELCQGCHSAALGYGPLHSQHRPDSSGSRCVSCHMPRDTYGLLHVTRSHHISSPSVSSDLDAGRPNACSLCHANQSLSWVAEQLTTHWRIGSGAPHVLREAHIPRLLLTGDAGQRALAAAALGDPSQAGLLDWQAPLLLASLDDPEPAVRYVVKEALKGLQHELGGYDYLAPTGSSHAQVRQWLKDASPASVGRLARALGVSPSESEAQIFLLQARRDDRPMTLGE